MNANSEYYKRLYYEALAEVRDLKSKVETQEWELRRLRHEVARRDEVIRERVEDETSYLLKRIDLILQANQEQAQRIKELEKQKTIEIHREDAEPNRYDMIAMCKEKEWWLGGDVLMDEEETLRYPWIDFRDEFRNIRIKDFFEWIHQNYNEYKNARQRERYANDSEYRKHILERLKAKRQCRKK